MTRRRRPTEVEMDDFVDDDLESNNSHSSFQPGYSSPLPILAPQSVQRSPDYSGRSTACVVACTSSIGPKIESIEALSSTLVPDSGVVDHQRPRTAAASAYSNMRKHARMDLGYVSDIAEADDSDEPDELDAETQLYAPFEIQIEAELEDSTWGEVPECEDVGSLNGKVTITSDRFVELGSRVQTDSYFPLIKHALLAEKESGPKFGAYLFYEAEDYWEAMSLLTLCSMPERAVKELVCGNLKQAYDSDTELRQKLDEFRERGKQHPCIYVRILTATDGTLMTTAETKRLASWLQRYVSTTPEITDNPHCKEAFKRIDDQFRGQWKRVNPEADRAYLASQKQKRLRSRVDNVLLFCSQLLARCKTSEENRVPLKPLLYIGYAARADRRKRQHEACGTSSNWLATLVKAVCNVLWGQGHFKMHFMVICMLSSEWQGMIAEMLLTRIAGAYYNVGGGFCIDVAGKSMESIHFSKLTHRENVDHWNTLAEWVAKNTPVEANRTECIRRMQEEQDWQIAATVTRIEATKTEIAHMAAKHIVRVKLWSAATSECPEDADLQAHAEMFEKYTQEVEELMPLAKAVLRPDT